MPDGFVLGDSLPERGVVVRYPTHDWENGSTIAGWGASRLEHLHGVLSIDPVVGLCLCALVRALDQVTIPCAGASGLDAAARCGATHQPLATNDRFGTFRCK